MSSVPRDPETGQFLPRGAEQFDDIEVATFAAGAGVAAANMTGGTGFEGGDVFSFEGLTILDYDEYVDRNEELHLITAYHELTVFANSTETADGNVVASVEVSSSPSLSGAVAPVTTNSQFDGDVAGGTVDNDSIDTIGRPLQATGHAPFSDGATGVGGGGSEGHDTVAVAGLPSALARFHPRDELFFNGVLKAWNIDDAGIHALVQGQHVYGVARDD